MSYKQKFFNRRTALGAVSVGSFLLVLYGQGCSGFKSLQTASDSSLSSESLACTPSSRGTSELTMRRLTRAELLSSLTALFGASVMSDPRVTAAVQSIPTQETVNNTLFDNSIADVEGLESASDTIVTVLFEDSSAVNAALGGCTLTDLPTCTNSLIKNFGLKAFRRPVPADTETSIRTLVTQIGGLDGLKNGITRVLISPYFTQHIELGDSADTCTSNCPDVVGNRIHLSSYEVAARLAFAVTGAPPDSTLLTAAAANQLGDLTSLRAQATRLLATPGARANWQRILGEYLGLKQLSDPNSVVGQDLGIDANGFAQEALADLSSYTSYEIFDKKADFATFLTDKVVIPSTPRLAKAYGVAQSTTPTAVTNGLGGLILRPAPLMTANTVSSPILRGVFIQRKVLCNQIPSPDPGIVASRLADLASVSHVTYANRDLVATVTSPNVCMGCHSMINPSGFPLENFGPFGTPRTIEKIYDTNGPTSVTHPINTAVNNFHLGSSLVSVADGAAMQSLIAQNTAAAQCFDAALIVNTSYRALDQTDNCSLGEMASLHAGKKSVAEIILQSTVNDGIFWKSAAGAQ